MWKLFGRPEARTGDLTRAVVEQQALQLSQGMRKPGKPWVRLVARPPLRLVGKRAGTQRERSHTSQ